MKTITFCSVKGGTGKSTLSILTALVLKGMGEKVLFVDLDPQHSSSFFFSEDNSNKSIFRVLMGEPLQSQLTTINGIDLLASDLRLLDTRTIETNRLRRALKDLDYSYVIIDTAPTYDSLTQNAYLASDIIIIPSTLDPFSHKTAHFLLNKLYELEVNAQIGIILNLWKRPKETISDNAYSVREAKVFLQDEQIKDILFNCSIPRLNTIKRAITEKGYKLKGKGAEHIFNMVSEITGKQSTLEFIGG